MVNYCLMTCLFNMKRVRERERENAKENEKENEKEKERQREGGREQERGRERKKEREREPASYYHISSEDLFFLIFKVSDNEWDGKQNKTLTSSFQSNHKAIFHLKWH